jgi:uncharacterized membrane protein YccC
VNNDHASNGALLLSYIGAVASWFTGSHVLGLLTAIFTLINIAIGLIKLSRMLKGGM